MKSGYLLLLVTLITCLAVGCNRPAKVDTTVETNPTPHKPGVKVQATTGENVN